MQTKAVDVIRCAKAGIIIGAQKSSLFVPVCAGKPISGSRRRVPLRAVEWTFKPFPIDRADRPRTGRQVKSAAGRARRNAVPASAGQPPFAIRHGMPRSANHARAALVIPPARIAEAGAGADADADAALANFDGAVLQALKQTETALSAYSQEMRRERSLAQARDDAAHASDQANRLFRFGRTSFLDFLSAEATLADAESALAVSRAQVIDRQVDLFLALGGGWATAPKASHEQSSLSGIRTAGKAIAAGA
jgi:hypothetical protein